MQIQVVDSAARFALADALGDTPETVAAVHGLVCGFSDAWVIGEPPGFRAACVQPRICRTLVEGFGHDPAALARILPQVPGWNTAVIATDVARPICEAVTAERGSVVICMDDIVYLAGGPVPEITHPDVRLLFRDDREALQWLFGWGFTRERLEHILHNGVVACAIVDGRTVSTAYTDSWTTKFAELTAGTDREWENRGLATAAASLVARKVMEQGRTPVWSVASDHSASRRIAAKLGFSEASRRVELRRVEQATAGAGIPERPKDQ